MIDAELIGVRRWSPSGSAMSPARRRRLCHVLRREDHATVVLIGTDGEVARWPLVAGGRPDLSTVDELARLQLIAGRLGCSIGLRDACVELVQLLELVGLRGMVAVDEAG
jgi:hypothetical protein